MRRNDVLPLVVGVAPTLAFINLSARTLAGFVFLYLLGIGVYFFLAYWRPYVLLIADTLDALEARVKVLEDRLRTARE